MLPPSFSKTIDRIALGILGAIPDRLMRRLLNLLRDHPSLPDRWGFFIRLRHFYEPLPDFPTIDPARLARRRESPAIDWRLEHQRARVNALTPWAPEVQALRAEFDFLNPEFCALDAAVYYALLRWKKPARVIEIGAGWSTRIATKALARNAAEGSPAKLICVEPYPDAQLKNLGIELLAQPVQEVALDLFGTLTSGDILFINSTHTVKFDSDVCREILEIVPMVAPGVWIHFHDVFFPYDYPPDWILKDRRGWNEQYLVEAFLSGNRSFAIEIANHWLATDYPSDTATLWPETAQWGRPSYGAGSLWISRTV